MNIMQLTFIFIQHLIIQYKDLSDEIVFNINKDEQLFRLIPIIKDIDNPENVFNKFKLGIVTTSIKLFPSVDSNK